MSLLGRMWGLQEELKGASDCKYTDSYKESKTSRVARFFLA